MTVIWIFTNEKSLSDGPDLIFYKYLFMQITDLLVNITKHVLKPKHRILTEGEKQVLLQKYSIEAKQVSRVYKDFAYKHMFKNFVILSCRVYELLKRGF